MHRGLLGLIRKEMHFKARLGFRLNIPVVLKSCGISKKGILDEKRKALNPGGCFRAEVIRPFNDLEGG
jgi:hypothetical protein